MLLGRAFLLVQNLPFCSSSLLPYLIYLCCPILIHLQQDNQANAKYKSLMVLYLLKQIWKLLCVTTSNFYFFFSCTYSFAGCSTGSLMNTFFCGKFIWVLVGYCTSSKFFNCPLRLVSRGSNFIIFLSLLFSFFQNCLAFINVLHMYCTCI